MTVKADSRLRHLHGTVLAGAFALGVGPGCRDGSATAEPEPDCIRDGDCGASQVCRAGQCFEVKPPVNELTEVAPVDPSGYRGGPGQWGALRGTAPQQAPTLLWEQPLGAPVSAAPVLTEVDGETWAVVGAHHGRLVGAVVDGKREPGLLALDVWLPGIIWGTAAIADGVVFVGADDDHLHAFELATGKPRFHMQMGDCEPPRAPGPMGMLCDVDGGPTLVPSRGGAAGARDLVLGANGVYRVTAKGELRWHTPIVAIAPEEPPSKKKSKKKKSKSKKSKSKKSNKQADEEATKSNSTDGPSKPVDFLRRVHVYASPLVTPTGDVFVGTQGGGLVALTPEGRVRWQVPLRGDVDAAPVLTDDGLIVVGDDGGNATAFDPAGNQRWRVHTGAPIQAPLAVDSRGEVVVATTEGKLLAIGTGGSERWSAELDGPILAAPRVDASGAILVVTQSGTLYALSPRGKTTWQLALPSEVDGGVALSDQGV
ncbi:MAG: PQQ-binding-like beta-propeller repeat protein, partial [Nannocystaceae bacterium]